MSIKASFNNGINAINIDEGDELRRLTEEFLGRGYQITLEGRSPEADGGSRVVFLDPAGTLPAMLEVMELDAGFETALQQLHQLSQDWDGTDPVRDMSDVSA